MLNERSMRATLWTGFDCVVDAKSLDERTEPHLEQGWQVPALLSSLPSTFYELLDEEADAAAAEVVVDEAVGVTWTSLLLPDIITIARPPIRRTPAVPPTAAPMMSPVLSSLLELDPGMWTSYVRITTLVTVMLFPVTSSYQAWKAAAFPILVVIQVWAALRPAAVVYWTSVLSRTEAASTVNVTDDVLTLRLAANRLTI